MLPEYEWLPAAASGGALLLLFLWTVRYLRVMAPKAGTLEWIRRADRGRFSPLYLQPVRTGGYLLLTAVFLFGLVYGVIGTEYRMNDWFPAVAAALPAVICALMLLRLFGAVLPAACGTVLLTAAGLPSLPLLLCLLLMLLSLSCARFLLQLLLLLPALCILFLCVGSGFAVLLILLSYLLLYLLCAYLREPRAAPGVLPGLLILLLWMAAGFAGTVYVFRAEGLEPLAAILRDAALLIEWQPEWAPQTSIPALLPAIMLLPLLVQARRLRNTVWLFSAVASLLSLQFVLCGLPELSYFGCAAALTGTFAGAEHRGGRFPALLTAAGLTLCIFIC